jgi:hypothetical protein
MAVLLATLLATFAFYGQALAKPALCQGDPGSLPVYVQDDSCPLTGSHNKAFFNEMNFVPGDSKISWVDIKNNSGQPQRATIKALDFSHPMAASDLARVLEISISLDGGNGRRTDIFGGPGAKKTLLQFFEAGEIHLSNIAPGKSNRYYLAVSFPSRLGNDWQGRTTDFSIIIGFPDNNNREVIVHGCLPGDKKQDKIAWSIPILRWLSPFGIFFRQAVAFHRN